MAAVTGELHPRVAGAEPGTWRINVLRAEPTQGFGYFRWREPIGLTCGMLRSTGATAIASR